MISLGSSSITADTNYGTIHSADTIVQTETVKRAPVAHNTEAVVREYFSDIPVMIAVARCESQFRHTMADGTVLRGRIDSRDTGVMQINTGYHGSRAVTLGLDLTELEDNLAYARNLYEQQGTQPWSASRPCWGGSLAYGG